MGRGPKSIAVVALLALAGCVTEAHADGVIAQTGPTMRADAGAARPVSEPLACTPLRTTLRSPAPHARPSARACDSDDACEVTLAGACCPPCGTRTIPIARARAVARNEVVGCPIARPGCPACAGRFALEPDYDVACIRGRCELVRLTYPDGCAPEASPNEAE